MQSVGSVLPDEFVENTNEIQKLPRLMMMKKPFHPQTWMRNTDSEKSRIVEPAGQEKWPREMGQTAEHPRELDSTGARWSPLLLGKQIHMNDQMHGENHLSSHGGFRRQESTNGNMPSVADENSSHHRNAKTRSRGMHGSQDRFREYRDVDMSRANKRDSLSFGDHSTNRNLNLRRRMSEAVDTQQNYEDIGNVHYSLFPEDEIKKFSSRSKIDDEASDAGKWRLHESIGDMENGMNDDDRRSLMGNLNSKIWDDNQRVNEMSINQNANDEGFQMDSIGEGSFVLNKRKKPTDDLSDGQRHGEAKKDAKTISLTDSYENAKKQRWKPLLEINEPHRNEEHEDRKTSTGKQWKVNEMDGSKLSPQNDDLEKIWTNNGQHAFMHEEKMSRNGGTNKQDYQNIEITSGDEKRKSWKKLLDDSDRDTSSELQHDTDLFGILNHGKFTNVKEYPSGHWERDDKINDKDLIHSLSNNQGMRGRKHEDLFQKPESPSRKTVSEGGKSKLGSDGNYRQDDPTKFIIGKIGKEKMKDLTNMGKSTNDDNRARYPSYSNEEERVRNSQEKEEIRKPILRNDENKSTDHRDSMQDEMDDKKDHEVIFSNSETEEDEQTTNWDPLPGKEYQIGGGGATWDHSQTNDTGVVMHETNELWKMNISMCMQWKRNRNSASTSKGPGADQREPGQETPLKEDDCEWIFENEKQQDSDNRPLWNNLKSKQLKELKSAENDASAQTDPHLDSLKEGTTEYSKAESAKPRAELKALTRPKSTTESEGDCFLTCANRPQHIRQMYYSNT
ncbi:hypothetical protein AB6A40_009061 [Gnathostoma spinigerum]|uniref:Uncharacterized protein n=1 Tax=Gnathostoma spinigerum TaxID=75299 RepID=A0ABD6EZV9_9BILA